MDRERSYRRLTRHLDGIVLVLAEDDFTYRSDQDYTVVVEAIGSDLAVYLDSERVFRVTDETHPEGGIGLYCWPGLPISGLTISVTLRALPIDLISPRQTTRISSIRCILLKTKFGGQR